MMHEQRFKCLIVFLVSIVACVLTCMLILGSKDLYKSEMHVQEIKANEIVLVDNSGFLWIITDRDDLRLNANDCVVCTMCNNKTTQIEDDIIVSVKKAKGE
mgnify:CR=1 FL=1